MPGETPLGMMRAGPRQSVARRNAAPARRRGRTVVALIAVTVALAAGWCGLWYVSANTAGRTLAGWLQREAAAGRVYTCGSEGISGFPFRIVSRCVDAAAALNRYEPPLAVAAKDITFTAAIYHPTRLVGELTGPVTIAAAGQMPNYVANWSRAELRVSGLPPYPSALSVSIAQPQLDHVAGGQSVAVFTAGDAVLQASIIAGSPDNNPVIDMMVELASATAPGLHPALAQPVQARIELVLRGLHDLSARPMAERIRQLQEAGGSIEIKRLRIARPDAIVVGSGALTVNAHGKLDGLVTIEVSGLDAIVPLLGVDRLIDRGVARLTGANGQPGQGLSALDRLMPGLSGVVRQTANASLVDDIRKMGHPTQIDGKPATALPLRVTDGAVYLGIMRIGEVPPLF